MAVVHKRQLKTQIHPGKDKCGKRNCLIVKTIEKRVRVRAGNSLDSQGCGEEAGRRLQEDLKEEPVTTVMGESLLILRRGLAAAAAGHPL